MNFSSSEKLFQKNIQSASPLIIAWQPTKLTDLRQLIHFIKWISPTIN